MNYIEIQGHRISYQNQELGTLINGSLNSFSRIDLDETIKVLNDMPQDECIKFINNYLIRVEDSLNYFKRQKLLGHDKAKENYIQNTANLMRDVLDALRGTQ